MDLRKLFGEDSNLEKCTGCSILSSDRPRKCILDYEDLEEAEILFLSDSLKSFEGDFVPFRYNEYKIIRREIAVTKYDKKVAFAASVKCPNVKDKEMSSGDKRICRTHLLETIKKVKPKLVFTCGKLATEMVAGKKIAEKDARGVVKDMDFEGIQFKYCSIFHPYQVIIEPKNSLLFSTDIVNTINGVILGIEKKVEFDYIPILSIEDLDKYSKIFLERANIFSFDIETTGLNFLTDTINTVALTAKIGGKLVTISIPIDHKENNLGLRFKAKTFEFLKTILQNPEKAKILQEATFDLKFMIRYGIPDVKNIYDTKLMQNLFYEGVPRKLKHLVNYYFPDEVLPC